MSNSAKHEIFRFLTVRPAELREPEDTIALIPEGGSTPLYQELTASVGQPDHKKESREAAERFIQSDAFVNTLDDVDADFASFAAWLDSQAVVSRQALVAKIKEILGATAARVTAKPAFQNARIALGDSLLAITVAGRSYASRKPKIVKALRVLALLEAIGRDDAAVGDDEGVNRARSRLILLPAELFPVGPDQIGGQQPQNPRPGQDKRRAEFEGTRRALDQLSALFVAELAEIDQAEAMENTMRSATPPEIAGSKKPVIAACGMFPPSAVRRLPPELANALKTAGIDLTAMPIHSIADRLANILADLHAELFPPRPLTTVVRVGSGAIPMSALTTSNVSSVTGTGTCTSARPVGVADLMVVRQSISRYEMGEIAHIENVLQGESKERTHRRTHRTEETFSLITDRTEETERDLETAERFELQREAAETIRRDTSLDAGVTVTGSYGSVRVTAHANIAIENAREESTRTATTYSRDVTDRSVVRVQEQVREERTRRITTEIEEVNRHGLNNVASTEHVSGIYRWVDKLYRAQIYNYGRRLMFEFIVPEPAALLFHAMATRPPEGVTLERPEPPTAIGGGSPLTPQDIQRWNYQHWVAQYRVSGVTPPPDIYRIATFAYKTEDEPERNREHYENATSSIEIPEGFIPMCGFVAVTHIPDHLQEVHIYFSSLLNAHYVIEESLSTDLTLSIAVGRRTKVFESVLFNARAHLTLPEGAVVANGLPVAISVVHSVGAALTIEILCRAGERLLAEWQARTYDAIMTAYLNLKSAYDEQLAASDVRAGVMISGGNPLTNRDVEKTELKRAAISLLACRELDLGAIATSQPLGYPELDFTSVDADGHSILETQAGYIQFFEQAFEWPQLTYLFYPYFWGRRSRWLELMQLEDVDPLRTQFLQAGAARVLVPVRPGYEGSILHYVETGQIWDGGGPPDVTSPEYYPLAEEIRDIQGAGPEGVAVGDPWDVRLPTPLVLLQRDATLPEWPVT